MTREEAIYILKAIQAFICPNKESVLENNFSEAFDAAIEALSIEVVQGEWIRKEQEINDCDGHRAYYWYECSVCGASPPKDTWKNEWHSNFCPSCGARMENK